MISRIAFSFSCLLLVFFLNTIPFYKLGHLSVSGIEEEYYSAFIFVVNCIFLIYLAFFFACAIKNARKRESFIGKKDCLLYSTLCLYPFLSLLAINISELNFFLAFLFVLSFAILYLIFFLILNLFLKNREKSIYVTVLFSIFMNFAGFFPNHKVVFAAVIIFLATLIVEINTKQFSKFLKPFSFVLIFFILFDFASVITPYITFQAKTKTEIISKTKFIPKNDVYIILADMYTGSDTLKSDYSFDNGEFYDELKKLGFLVFDSTYSNYNKTQLTLASIFEGDYVQNLSYKGYFEAIAKNRLFKNAKLKGYETLYATMLPLGIDKKNYIDELIIYNEIQKYNLIKLFLSNTVFDFVAQKTYPKNHVSTISEFLFLMTYPRASQGARFWFFHIMAPHYPYVNKDNQFGGNDHKISAVDSEFVANKPAYASYMKYTNNEILKAVKAALKNSITPPVIVIMGDHGARLHYFESNERKHFNELKEERHVLKAHFNTLFAIYCPEKEKSRYKNINSLINFFIEL